MRHDYRGYAGKIWNQFDVFNLIILFDRAHALQCTLLFYVDEILFNLLRGDAIDLEINEAGSIKSQGKINSAIRTQILICQNCIKKIDIIYSVVICRSAIIEVLYMSRFQSKGKERGRRNKKHISMPHYFHM